MQILILALSGMILVELLISLYFFRFACARNFRQKRRVDSEPLWVQAKEEGLRGQQIFLDAQPQEVSLRSRDGLTLRGLFYQNKDSLRTVLLVHGYRASRGGLSDFGVILPYYMQLGLNILLIDQRAHGRSEGNYIAFGSLERFDCADWAAWLDRRFEGKGAILLDGISMGAATVLLASGLPLPRSVRGIVADCGYSCPYDQLVHVSRHMLHLPAWPTVPLIELWARVLGGFSLKPSAAQALRHNRRLPVLFVHGEADNFVPCSASRENYDACAAEKQLVTIPGAPHGLSYLTDRPRCEQMLGAFIQRTLGAENPRQADSQSSPNAATD